MTTGAHAPFDVSTVFIRQEISQFSGSGKAARRRLRCGVRPLSHLVASRTFRPEVTNRHRSQHHSLFPAATQSTTPVDRSGFEYRVRGHDEILQKTTDQSVSSSR